MNQAISVPASVPAAKARFLPCGRVEIVCIVDPALREILARERHAANGYGNGSGNGNEHGNGTGKGEQLDVRAAFDLKAFGVDEEGKPRSDKKIVVRVGHCLRVILAIMKNLTLIGLRPVFARKHDDDTIDVVLWKHANNPPVPALTVRGYEVRFFEIPWGTQCQDFDESLNEITDFTSFEI